MSPSMVRALARATPEQLEHRRQIDRRNELIQSRGAPSFKNATES